MRYHPKKSNEIVVARLCCGDRRAPAAGKAWCKASWICRRDFPGAEGGGARGDQGAAG
jgi:hypothetical protein